MAKKATKKATAKKTTAKKAAPKKATAKKATAKKAAPKKATAKKATAKKATAKKAAAPKKKSARKPNAAFMKALTPSAELAAVIGAGAAARTEVVKKLWAYIRKHNLQNPKNKRNILADDKLSKVFGKKEVSMFELASLIGKHLK